MGVRIALAAPICTGGGIGIRARLRTWSLCGLRVRDPPCAPYALLAQLVEQQPFKPQVVGSSPAKRTTTSAQLSLAEHRSNLERQVTGSNPAADTHGILAQLVERQAEVLRVSGPNPEDPTTMHRWRNGIRSSLRNWCPPGCASSSLALCTTYGGIAKWPKAPDCKSGGLSFSGSNPLSPTSRKPELPSQRNGIRVFL